MAQSIEATVSKAIMTAFNASATLQAAIPGNIHREKVRGPSAGTAQTRPYAVMQIRQGPATNIYNTNGDCIDFRHVTFFIYDSATNMGTADAAVAALRTAFHYQPLTDTSPTYAAVSVVEVPVDEGKLIAQPQRAGESQWQAVWSMQVCSCF